MLTNHFAYVQSALIAALLPIASMAHAIELSFDDPSFNLVDLSWQSTGSPVGLVDDGLHGSRGIEPAIWRPDREWSRVVYRNEVFDTGIPCCQGDPVVPLSVMFRYGAPTLSPDDRLTSPFAGLLLSSSISVGPRIETELGWHQDDAGAPLEFYIRASSTAGSGAGRRVFRPDLQLEDGNWYRLATTFGESNAGNHFEIKLEDFGPTGGEYLETLIDSTLVTNSAKFGVNDSYAGFSGAIRHGGGALVFDEFHDTFGDFDSSGVVDAADYTLWRDTLLQTGSGQIANHSGDVIVDADDYQIWRENFGRRAFPASPPAASFDVVPEPTALSLAATLLAIVPVRCRR